MTCLLGQRPKNSTWVLFLNPELKSSRILGSEQEENMNLSSVPQNVSVCTCMCARPHFQQNTEVGSGKTSVQYENEGPIVGTG